MGVPDDGPSTRFLLRDVISGPRGGVCGSSSMCVRGGVGGCLGGGGGGHSHGVPGPGGGGGAPRLRDPVHMCLRRAPDGTPTSGHCAVGVAPKGHRRCGLCGRLLGTALTRGGGRRRTVLRVSPTGVGTAGVAWYWLSPQPLALQMGYLPPFPQREGGGVPRRPRDDPSPAHSLSPLQPRSCWTCHAVIRGFGGGVLPRRVGGGWHKALVVGGGGYHRLPMPHWR